MILPVVRTIILGHYLGMLYSNEKTSGDKKVETIVE